MTPEQRARLERLVVACRNSADDGMIDHKWALRYAAIEARDILAMKEAKASTRVNVTASEMMQAMPGLSEEVARDYLAFRKSKKAPLTATAWKGIVSEYQKTRMEPNECLTYCQVMGWRGFKSEWVEKGYAASQRPTERGISPAERTRRAIEDRRRNECAR
jgi:hypothetical protein